MKNETPLVSILIPLYNAEKYFEETMESLLAQTYKNIEIIIVDDGSTDGSLNIAKNYERKCHYIKVYTQVNSGASAARNKAFEMSKGTYVQYFDADDIMHPYKIELQVAALMQYGFEEDIVATGMRATFINTIDNAVYQGQKLNKDYDDKYLFFRDAWERSEYIIGQSWLIHRNMNKKVGKWNIRFTRHQDGEFFTRVVYNAKKILFVKESIIYYRKGISNSISSDRSYNAMQSHIYLNELRFNLVKDHIDQYALHKALAKTYSDFYAGFFPLLNKKMKKEILEKLKGLGYSSPIVEFKTEYTWIIKLVGIDVGLRLGKMKANFSSVLKSLKKVWNSDG